MRREDAIEDQQDVIEEARALLQRNLPSEAARLLQDNLNRRAGTAAEYMLLGVALAGAGEGLSAIQALEQAISLEPDNAAVHFNLGQVYLQGGRRRQALAAFDRALELRPQYPAAAQAAAELRLSLAGTSASARRAPSDFEPGSPSRFAPPVAPAEPQSAEGEPRTLREAAVQLLLRPGEAFNGGMDGYFNTAGAIPAVIGLFLLSIAAAALIAATFVFRSANAGGATPLGNVPLVVLSGFVNVIATAGIIACYNRFSEETGDFIADFGSLALSFAMISATITLATAPIAIVLALVGGPGPLLLPLVLVLVGAYLWRYGLQVALVCATTDLPLFAAMILLGIANMGAAFAAQSLERAVKMLF
jgi:tetratricopeptide (TPR) repeat protein